MNTILSRLIDKYQGNVPRYTSYPTPDQWSNSSGHGGFGKTLKTLYQGDESISLYIHIPFCQKLCYYCACNTMIRSRNHAPTDDYLDHLELEMKQIASKAMGPLKVNQLHLGGGTPTFLNLSQLKRLLQICHQNFRIGENSECSFETDPSTCTKEQIQLLFDLGFTRISFGVQDFDPEVLQAVNRDNSPEQIDELVGFSRHVGYKSVNLDFIYGLPYQTTETALSTVDHINQIRPDRIALYNFAYLPKAKKHHQLLPADRLPDPLQKANIFMAVSQRLLHHGFQAIGMDHFALPEDELSKATRNGTLTRNFMGYTTRKSPHVLGTGLTGISFLQNQYFQNLPVLSNYRESLQRGMPPIVRNYALSDRDIRCKYLIDDLMCNLRIDPEAYFYKFREEVTNVLPDLVTHLNDCIEDKLLTVERDESNPVYTATLLGKIFLRSIAKGLDPYLVESSHSSNLFSKAV